MNAKQSLRKASKHIEELEDWNNKAKHDIKAYNACIDGVIAGKNSFCDWCEEKRLGDCDKPEMGTGCSGWWLADVTKLTELIKTLEEGDDADGEENLSKGILSASPES